MPHQKSPDEIHRSWTFNLSHSYIAIKYFRSVIGTTSHYSGDLDCISNQFPLTFYCDNPFDDVDVAILQSPRRLCAPNFRQWISGVVLLYFISAI
uniref:Uncharacterized protein n=1 Tax=Parascaris equorum TaxID=6256 RepID=A0A914RU46_PAREQ